MSYIMNHSSPRILKISELAPALDFFKFLLNDYEGDIAYDYETWGDKNALRPDLCKDFRILCIGIGIDSKYSRKYPYDGVGVKFDTLRSPAPKSLTAVWMEVIKKSGCIAQNAKYEHKCNIKKFGFTTILRDTMLAMRVLNETLPSNLGSIGTYCKIPWIGYKAESVSIQENPHAAPLLDLLEYSAYDGATTYQCGIKLFSEVGRLELDTVLVMQQQFAYHLAYVEMNGMMVNRRHMEEVKYSIIDELKRVKSDLNKDRNIIKVRRWAINNLKSFKDICNFNAKSYPQMRHLCIDVLKLKVKLKKGKWVNGVKKADTLSFDKEVLEKHKAKYPVLGIINKIRSLEAMLAGFLDKYEYFIGPDGCVHTNYNQDVVVTGRLSSSAPNLQNIPVESIVRSVFTSRYEDGWLISSDYSQLEPRILAGWSGDKEMCKALNDGLDLHRFVGAKIYAVKYDDVTDTQRSIAKKRNLGSMYGQTAEGLAEATGLSLDECKEIVNIYDKSFPDIKKFRDIKHAEAFKTGVVRDLFGAMRHLPDAQSTSRFLQERAFRQSSNFPVQSTGNTFHLIAMCVLGDLFEAYKLEACVIGVEHDKLYVDAAGRDLVLAVQLTKQAMLVHNNAYYWRGMPVKMKVDIKMGRNLQMMDVY